MTKRESPTSIVNEQQLYGWRDRVRDIDAEIKTLSAERQKLSELIEMAQRLASEAQILAAATGSDSGHPRFIHETLQQLEALDAFPKAIMAIVDRREDGASYDDIREAILLSPLAERYNRSDKGFYHALRRFKQSGDLVDYHGYVFTPSNLAAFLKKVEAGLKEDKAVSKGRATRMMEMILEVIARKPGVIAKDVIAEIRSRDAELNERLSNNDGSAYNAIARFKKQGVVEGFGHLDRHLRIGPNADEQFKILARTAANVVQMPKRSEAPNGQTVGASEGRESQSLPFSTPADPRQS